MQKKTLFLQNGQMFRKLFFSAIKLLLTYFLAWTCCNVVESFFRFCACDAGLCVDMAQMAKKG